MEYFHLQLFNLLHAAKSFHTLINITVCFYAILGYILIFITGILLVCHKLLEPNRYFTLKMESDIHDSFISPTDHENKKATVC